MATIPISLSQITARFEENGLRYVLLSLQNGVRILISEYGGRVFGPFFEENGESLYWIHPAFAQADTFHHLLKTKEWNLGGDRMWIAPEIQYLNQNRTNFTDNIIPWDMDPGNHKLDEPQPGCVRMRNELSLTARVIASGVKQLHYEMTVRRAEDPLRYLQGYDSLIDGVSYAGYEQVTTLQESHPDAIMSEIWNVIQLHPGGSILIPTAPNPEVTDYEQKPVTSKYQTVHGNYVSVKITGQSIFKTGYKSAQVTGRIAYFHRLNNQDAYLVIRNFYNNPSSVYIEEPFTQPGRVGDSVHVYNDSGMLGGYGELECHGQTIGGTTGRSTSIDPFALWVYKGPVSKLKAIAACLLGIRL